MESKPERLLEDGEAEKAGVADALLDFSFKRAITPRIVKPLFIIGLIISAVYAAYWVFKGFDRGIIEGLVSLLSAPLIFLFYALITRVLLEIVVVLFQIADHLKNIDSKTH